MVVDVVKVVVIVLVAVVLFVVAITAAVGIGIDKTVMVLIKMSRFYFVLLKSYDVEINFVINIYIFVHT